MKPRYPLAATFVASILAACTSPAQPVAVQQPAAVAKADAGATPSVTPAETSGIRLPAAELRQRILKLMDSLRSDQDTNAPQVAKTLGIELAPHSQSPNMRAAELLTTEGWPAYFITMKYTHVPRSRTDISMRPKDAGVGKISKTCSFELDAFVADIEKMGYVRRGEIRFPGRPIEWPFDRGHNAAYIQQYQADDGAGATKLCVYAISLG